MSIDAGVTSGAIKLSGFKELSDGLMEFPDALGGSVLKKGLYKSAVVIRDAAQARCPVDTGHLRDFIGRGVGKPENSDRYEAVVLVGLVSMSKSIAKKRGMVLPNAFYGKFVEFGTRFSAAEPFLGPAFDTQIDTFLDYFSDELSAAIDLQWEKLGGRI
jgi:HK97 gp10 family phage protein